MLGAVAQRAKDVLYGLCETHGYALSTRLKTAESVAEKIETGRFDRWSDLDDLFAATIIVPSHSHEANLLEVLREEFEEHGIKLRGSTKKAPDTFRFDATRFIARHRPVDTGSPEPVTEVPFEIQVKTAFEHAWSVATHSLTYKTGKVDWRRLRLAAQIKASVEQLDMLIAAFEDSASVISPSKWPELETKTSVVEFFSSRVGDLIPGEAAPKDWSRFAENFVALSTARKDVYGNKKPDAVATALTIMDEQLRALAASGTFPLSISLCQLCAATLLESKHLNNSLYRYRLLVTPELTALYPQTKQVTKRFDLEFPT